MLIKLFNKMYDAREIPRGLKIYIPIFRKKKQNEGREVIKLMHMLQIFLHVNYF